MAESGPLTIAVLVKQVPDMNATRVDRLTGKVVPGAQPRVSSYDEYAIEAALRLTEEAGGEVVIITAGPAGARDAITRGLTMGADRGIHLEVADVNATDTLGMARLLADAARPLGCDLLLAGQTADDFEAGQVGAQVAALLDLPLVSNVVSIEREGSCLLVRRDMEDGYQTVRVTLPALLLSSTGLPQPRIPSLKGIMGARKKSIEAIAATLPAERRLTWDEPYVPEKSAAGQIVQDVPAAEAAQLLVAWLREQKLL
jgi:electron transfer flavoprotein beta subunit